MSFANSLDLVCKAANYRIESDVKASLKNGYLRSVTPSLAGFVDADAFTTASTIGPDAIRLNNSKYCAEPKESFRIRSTTQDNSVVYVQNRCMGGLKKYVLLETIGLVRPDALNYMDDRMYFKLKNQVHHSGDISTFDLPLLLLKKDAENNWTLNLESFHADHWGEDDGLITAIRGVNATEFAASKKESIKLSTSCRDKLE